MVMCWERVKTLLDTNTAKRFKVNSRRPTNNRLTYGYIAVFLVLLQHFSSPLKERRSASRPVLLEVD
jgi:hypothetical protein